MEHTMENIEQSNIHDPYIIGQLHYRKPGHELYLCRCSKPNMTFVIVPHLRFSITFDDNSFVYLSVNILSSTRGHFHISGNLIRLVIIQKEAI